MRLRFWHGKTYNLARMSLRELVVAYLTYPAVLVYVALAVSAAALSAYWAEAVWRLPVAIAVAVLVYPLAWYLLHRFVLHGRYLYKSALTARTWKRIHFDHHQDPHDLRVLFGALYTTLPTIALVTLPVGWLIAGPSGAAAAFAAGIVSTLFYEFCHCIQHLSYAPRSRWLQRIKRLHLAHHFHNEAGNYGITNFGWDRLLGTYYPKPKLRPKSATVFNLGYTEEEARRYPWVAQLSGGTRGDGNPRRFRMGEGPFAAGRVSQDA